jgi:asparagine synthase (glutamine-hydrolysing)
MSHRGPDGAGIVVFSTAGLAMRRLAIIDVESGQQPLQNEDGRIQVVCNGEIYNFRELRATLQQAGHTFRTMSDCEVIVHGYEEYGDGLLPRLNGMFALAIWDETRRRLLLARDRVGIKPLYYTQHDGVFLFASEPKSLLAYPGVSPQLDLDALDQYLAYHYVPTPRTIYAGVRKLRPGHALVVEDGRTTEYAYWQLDLSPDPGLAHADESELAERLWSTLRECVRLEMVSDVPLGVFLSGGIDSSAIAAAMVDLGVHDVCTLSIGFEEPTFDESSHARSVAAQLGTKHHEMILEPRMMWELVPSVSDFLDEPLADASIIPTYLLSRFARGYVTVALGGDGGDELFAGYSTLQAHRLARYYTRIPRFLRHHAIAPAVRRLPVSHRNLSLDFRAKRFIEYADLPVADRHHEWLGPFGPEERRDLLSADVRVALATQATTGALREHVDRARSYDDLSQVLYLDMKMYLEGDILPKVDRASMANSLEVRVPLLNAQLLEFATRLPIGLKLRGLTRKYLFRKALAKRVPQHIIDRPKKGFGIPLAKWFGAELRELLLDTLHADTLRRQGLFDPDQVTELIDQHLERRRDNRMALWALLIFQLWHDRYLRTAARAARPTASVEG